MPSPAIAALMVGAAFCAGLVDAIAGGGGLVTLPALLAAGMPPRLALATNKGQAVFGATVSCATFWRKGAIDKPRAGLSFACAFCGSLAGARALLALRPDVLRPLVIALLLFALGVVLLRRPAQRIEAAPRRRGPVMALIALVLGAYDGFFGPGTGSLLIAAFVLLLGASPTSASADAKVANLGSNLAACLLFAHAGAVAWSIALPMAIANMSGAAIGARLAIAKGDRLVRFVVVLVVLGAIARVSYDLHEHGWRGDLGGVHSPMMGFFTAGPRRSHVPSVRLALRAQSPASLAVATPASKPGMSGLEHRLIQIENGSAIACAAAFVSPTSLEHFDVMQLASAGLVQF